MVWFYSALDTLLRDGHKSYPICLTSLNFPRVRLENKPVYQFQTLSLEGTVLLSAISRCFRPCILSY